MLKSYAEAGVVRTKGEEQGRMKGFFDNIKPYNGKYHDWILVEKKNHPTDQSYIVWLMDQIVAMTKRMESARPSIEFLLTVDGQQAYQEYLERIDFSDGVPVLKEALKENTSPEVPPKI